MPCRVQCWRVRARADWSSTGIAADSGASVPQADRRARARLARLPPPSTAWARFRSLSGWWGRGPHRQPIVEARAGKVSDGIDLGRQIARHLEADLLLDDLRLVPHLLHVCI